MPYIFKTVIASGTLAAGNAKLSMVDTVAFADSVGINLAQYVDGKAMLYLRNTTGGYEAFALLSAVGTGITYDSEKVANGTMETGDPPTSWSAKAGGTLSAVADERTGGVGSKSLGVLRGTSSSVAKQENIASNAGELIYFTGWVKSPDLVPCRMEILCPDITNYFDTANVTANAWTSYATYRTVSGNINIYSQILSAGNGRYDDISAKKVLTPSTSGVTLKNLAGAQSFIYKHASFNPNAEMLWRVVTDKKIYRIL